jgi:RHS repeat-associated protein
MIDHYVADITSVSDYYPFGSPMDGRTFSSEKYRFGFNGQEADDEITSFMGINYDFGDRMYDSRTGRWNKCDKKQEKYPGWSPYHFGYNNPIVTIDPDGEENVVVVGSEEHYETKGNKLMFMMQGIRSVRKLANDKEGTTVLLFTSGYTDKQIKAFKQFAIRHGATNIIEVNSADQVVNYINSKTTTSTKLSEARKSDPVSNVDAFAHGTPGRIAFGYAGPTEGVSNFNSESSSKLNSLAFGNDPVTGDSPVFFSGSCQFGNGANLAQRIANDAKITTKGYVSKTNYGNTFTLGDMGKYEAVGKHFGKEGAITFGIIKGKNASYGYYMHQMIQSLNAGRYIIDGALFDTRGALGGVKGDNNPSDVPKTEQTYTPQK